MSKRIDIKNKIITLLEGISGIGEVSRQLKNPDQIKPDKFPTAFVTNGQETKIDGDVNDLVNTLSVVIVAFVKNQEDPTNALDVFLEDIEKAICADSKRELGGIAQIINVVPRTIKTDEGSLTPFGMAEFTFDISYHQLYGIP